MSPTQNGELGGLMRVAAPVKVATVISRLTRNSYALRVFELCFKTKSIIWPQYAAGSILESYYQNDQEKGCNRPNALIGSNPFIHKPGNV